MNGLLMIGIMSGTSCDGIDTAIVRMDARPTLLHFNQSPMPEKLREPLLRLCEPGLDEIDLMGGLHMVLGRVYAQAALDCIAAAGMKASDIAAIGCHGQTIRHRPRAKNPFTLQIGDASVISELTGITTVSDFRSRDIAAGGEGAPLVPFAHRRLFAQKDSNIAVLNIGGIANITWLGHDGTTFGFDTGPGNMVMDALMLALSDGRCGYDRNGELAAMGRPCESLLRELLTHPFLHRSPPKSTGREDFGSAIVERIMSEAELSDADRMATALEFTARTIADCRRFLPDNPDSWLVCGGGTANRRLMQRLAELLAPTPVQATDAAGVPPQAVEAASFAILAFHTLMGTHNTLAAVTGARHDTCGGRIAPGSNWPQLIHHLSAWTR